MNFSIQLLQKILPYDILPNKESVKIPHSGKSIFYAKEKMAKCTKSEFFDVETSMTTEALLSRGDSFSKKPLSKIHPYYN